jgi:hypothetical protein
VPDRVWDVAATHLDQKELTGGDRPHPDHHPWLVPAGARSADSRGMNSSHLADLVIGLSVIAYLCARQLSWRPVDEAQMWKLPLVLGAAGVVSLAREHVTIRPIDLVILILSGTAALASGAAMGRIARFRPSAADPRMTESRTGWLGVAVWFALIAVRVVLDVVGHRMGSELAFSTGSILLVLALNRAANALVLSARRPGRAFAVAGK